MKGRDVRVLMQGRVDPVLMKLLEGFGEEMSEMQLQINQLATHVTKLTEVMSTMVHVTDGLERETKRMKNQEKQGVAVRSEEV